MDRKLIVEVRLLRESGWIIPRHRHAFAASHRGILTLDEERVPALNRHARVARLRDALTGALVEAVPPLIDATLLHAGADEWVIAGVEHVMHGVREADCAQTWLVQPVQLLGADTSQET